MLRPRKSLLNFPRWFEWFLAVALLLTAILEFTHQQYFWATFFTLAAILLALSAARVFGKEEKSDL